MVILQQCLGKFGTVATSLKWIIAKKTQGKSLIEKLQSQQTTWAETMGNFVMAEQNLRFEINFNMEVFNVVDEAKLMEKLGYKLPEPIVCAALERERLFKDIVAINSMLSTYNNIMEQLTLPEARLYQTYIIICCLNLL